MSSLLALEILTAISIGFFALVVGLVVGLTDFPGSYQSLPCFQLCSTCQSLCSTAAWGVGDALFFVNGILLVLMFCVWFASPLNFVYQKKTSLGGHSKSWLVVLYELSLFAVGVTYAMFFWSFIIAGSFVFWGVLGAAITISLIGIHTITKSNGYDSLDQKT